MTAATESQPALSVVVPSVNGWSDVSRCLAALERERTSVDLEVLVPERCGPGVRDRVAIDYPWAVVLPVPASCTIPMMRALAFDRATAPAVAVIEDHVLVRPGWARSLLSVWNGTDVLGGGVANAATTRLVDWAAFLCEYSHLLPPIPAGPADWVTGNNTLYATALLDAHREVTHAGRWENHLHDVLRASGVRLICHPEIVVDHRKHYTVLEYLTQRYWYARSYAGARVADAAVPRRVAFGAAALGLPPILFWRILSRCLRKDVPRALVWRSAPLLLLFVTSWGVGEAVGAWFGPGTSLERVC